MLNCYVMNFCKNEFYLCEIMSNFNFFDVLKMSTKTESIGLIFFSFIFSLNNCTFVVHLIFRTQIVVIEITNTKTSSSVGVHKWECFEKTPKWIGSQWWKPTGNHMDREAGTSYNCSSYRLLHYYLYSSIQFVLWYIWAPRHSTAYHKPTLQVHEYFWCPSSRNSYLILETNPHIINVGHGITISST